MEAAAAAEEAEEGRSAEDPGVVGENGEEEEAGAGDVAAVAGRCGAVRPKAWLPDPLETKYTFQNLGYIFDLLFFSPLSL